VQVGDPFLEKLLIEACLELMATDAIVAIQDMGAAGLTSSSVEMASKGGVGLRLWMERVPCREAGMTPYEMMLSESQERMLMVLKPGREAEAEAIFRKWALDFAVIGAVTDTGRLQLEWNGERVCDLPLAPIGDEAPKYDRPWTPTPPAAPLGPVPEPADVLDDLLRLMATPDLASRRWVWEQYDHMVGADTVQRPGGDAAVVRVHGTRKGLALTADCTPRYCAADPVEGGRQAVAEAWRNLTAVGATPLAITDCMNFAAPTRPEVMGQFVGCIEGMADACRALDFPVVSGNVSLYNETEGRGILPTPAIGAVGLLADWERSATLALKQPGEDIWLVGATIGHLGQSLWLRELHGREEGPPPPVDLAAERAAGDWVRARIADGTATAVHDVSDGGLFVALAEMALAGGIGLDLDAGVPGDAAWAFGEDQGRYILTVPEGTALPPCPVPLARLGTVGGVSIRLCGRALPLGDLRAAHEGFLPHLMER
jgi:phosphoribosylformylglycinamidine synthase